MSADQLANAARMGNKDAVTQLVRQQNADPNGFGADGRTALHWAVDQMRLAVVKELLELGARPDLQDTGGDTPVHIAVRNCRAAQDNVGVLMVEHLISRYSGPPTTLVNRPCGNGDTLVHMAIRNANPKTLEIMMRCQPNFQIPNHAGETGQALLQRSTPEIQAIASGQSPAAGGRGAPPQPRGRGRGVAPRGRGRGAPPQPGGRGRGVPTRPAESGGGGYTKSEFSGQMDVAAQKIADMKSSLGIGGPAGDVTDPNRPSGRVADASGILPALKQLQDHIKHLFETDGFEQEFAQLERLTQQHIQNEDFTTALLPHNKEKNRYTNILPFEKSRVVLTPVEGLVGSDYINASYMDGEVPGTERAYIAAQGPKQVTVFDFWRMVYELKITSIVMLGEYIEANKIKFWQYWPEDETYIDVGYFRVTFVAKEAFYGEVRLRRYKLTNTYTHETQDVVHLQYTAFPDHGVPEDTSGFLKLVTLAEDEATRDGRPRRPIIVHCSAGVGRTGMYIAVGITVAKLNYATTAGLLGKPPIPLTFEILNTLVQMRKQRPGMVQTKDQLIFCYLAVLEKVITQCNILDYENERWFNKVTAHEAIDILMAKGEGAFLFRPSSARGYCSMSYKKNDDVHHVRIQISSDGFICEGDEIRYSSLTKMVENKKAVLRIPHFAY